jgi:tetratricopeptide (TPR) repeat protein
VARSKTSTTGPGSIADTVAHLAIWARHAPRGFARVEYHSEYARAEADRRLGEVLLREGVPYHRIALPVRATPSQAGRYLLEHLEPIESGTVAITGFATAVAEEDRRDLLAILSIRREALAELGLCQIWWLTPDFLDDFIRIATDLDSWFMIRSQIDEEFLPTAVGTRTMETAPLMWPLSHQVWPKYPIDEALRGATSLVERFQRAKEIGAPTSELVELAVAAAAVIVGVGAPNLTRELAEEVVSGLNDAFGGPLADRLSTVRSHNGVARLLISRGRIKEAAPLIDRAWALLQQDEGPDNTDLDQNIHNLAGLHLDTNRPGRAELLYRRALEIAEREHRPLYLTAARCLNRLARLLSTTGRLGEAEALFRRALDLDERKVGREHPDVAADLSDLAVMLRTAGRLTEAEPLLRRALEIEERWLGPDDPVVAYDLGRLAVLLHEMARFDEAEALHRRALEIEERWLGPDHPAVARDLVNLALLLQDAGRLAEAEPLLRRALAIDERVYGPEHPGTARDRLRLESLLKAMNRPDEARALLQ